MQFSDLSLTPPLLQAVAEAGYTEPSPIQQKAIPPVLAGRDLLGCAQTGTGKTAAFALPILQLLAGRGAGHNTAPAGGKKNQAPQPAAAPAGPSLSTLEGLRDASGSAVSPAAKPASRQKQAPRPIRCLVLTPTRELALQIYESFEAYGKHLPLRSAVIFGGVGQAPQVAQLRRGIDILVATPGRLNDLIGQGYIKLENLEIFVLDEADRMLDMGFVNDVKKVMRHLPRQRQTLLFSATMPKEIVQLAASLLNNPVKVFVTPPATTVEKIEQSLYKVDKGNKRHLLAWLLKNQPVTSALVFTRTKHGADRVVRELKKEGVVAMAIHGNKSQNARQDALARLKDGRAKVLVATDIAARGLDISELSHVFNYDIPNIPETYVHRIGRTGRAGHEGVAISFCMPEELPFLADIEKLIGFVIPEVKNHPWPMQGTVEAPAGAPAQPQQRQQQKTQPKTQQKQNGRQATGQKAQTQTQSKKNAGQPAAENQTGKRSEKRQNQAPRQQGRGGKNMRREPVDPYEGLTGGKAIVTKRPVWSTGAAQPPEAGGTGAQEGEDAMARNNRRRSRGKGKSGRSEDPAKKVPEIKKNANGVFDFSEEELAQDDSIKIISRTNGETKYASFEDFLKDH